MSAEVSAQHANELALLENEMMELVSAKVLARHVRELCEVVLLLDVFEAVIFHELKVLRLAAAEAVPAQEEQRAHS